MSRTVKAPEVRRNEILDKAQELFYSKGYEQTSIRDIIDGVGIAKGTFYHYFSSKTELLDELVERMMIHIVQMVEPIVADKNLDALEKFHLFFGNIENWKIENKTFLKSLIKVYYHDDNVLLRYKLKTASIAATALPLGKIIRQGNNEGVFDTRFPDDFSAIAIEIGQSFGEYLAALLLKEGVNKQELAQVERRTAITNYSLERLLGANGGSIKIYDFDRIKQWFESDEKEEPLSNELKEMIT